MDFDKIKQASFEIREIRQNESDILNDIYHLRVLARNNEGYITFEKYPNGWYDKSDLTAVHFAVLNGKIPISAARINFYNNITSHPYFPAINHLSNLFLDKPVAYLSRVVVHPDFRRKGFSKSLVEKRELFAYNKNIMYLLADITGFQVDNFKKYGYLISGEMNTTKIEWDIEPNRFLMCKHI